MLNRYRIIAGIVCALLLAACGRVAAPDVEATVAAGVAATLAAQPAAATTASQPVAQPPADATLPPAAVGVAPTPTLAATATPPPSPTPLVLIAQGAPGDRQGIVGDVVTLQDLPLDPAQAIYGDRLSFQLQGAFDPNVGTNEGDGVQYALFSIFDANGALVHQKVESLPFYCVFGEGTPDCIIWVFSEHANRWPNGTPLTPGFHSAAVEAVGIPGVNADSRAFWVYDFQVLGSGDYQPTGAGVTIASALSVRIIDISLPGDRYWVAFETTGFTPQAGSTHLHFFWDTVAPEQAGAPGSGPWQIYPTGAGQPNGSPFTLFAAADRPAGATAICALVANADHSVQPGTGNCFRLP